MGRLLGGITVFGLRTKKQMTTQYSPYFLIFGRESRYPCEVTDNYEVSILNVNVQSGSDP